MEAENEYSINKSYDAEINNSTTSLDSKVLSTESRQIQIKVIKPRRRIIIEPMLMLYYLSSAPIGQVSQLFIYQEMEGIVANRRGFNMSLMDVHDKNHTASPCQEALNKSNIQYNFTQAAQTENAHYSMITRIVGTVPSLIAMVMLGSYSDKGGRRIAFVPFFIADFLSSILFFVVLYFKLSVWILQANTVIIGLSGGHSLMMVGCYSYIADITTKEERLFRFTLLIILEEMVSIIGPVGFGYWIKKQGFLWPIVFCMVVRFINTIYVIFFIPETVEKDGTATFFTLTHMKRSVRVFLKNDENNRRWKLWTLLMVFIVYCIGAGVSTPLSLFELNTPLCWDAVTLGYYKTARTAVIAFGGLCATKGLKLIVSDEAISIIASVAHASLYVYRTFVKNSLMMFLSLSFEVATIALMPTTRALMSQHVTSSEQGSIFGMIAVLESLALLAGAEFFSFVYAKTLYISTSFVFLIAAVIYSFVSVIYIFYTCRVYNEKRRYERLNNSE